MAPEAVRQAVGGGCQSGWGRLLSVANAIEAGTWRQGDSGWAQVGRPGGGGGGAPSPFQCTPARTPRHCTATRRSVHHDFHDCYPSTSRSPNTGVCTPRVRASMLRQVPTDKSYDEIRARTSIPRHPLGGWGWASVSNLHVVPGVRVPPESPRLPATLCGSLAHSMVMSWPARAHLGDIVADFWKTGPKRGHNRPTQPLPTGADVHLRVLL